MTPVARRVLTGARLALLAALALAAASARAATAVTNNYAEALQKSLYFYDAEKSGPGITGGRLEWRGDSELQDRVVPLKPKGAGNVGVNLSQAFLTANKAVLDPAGAGTVDLSGGMHDAGDHVKFGLPQAYAASTLGWGLYEFRDSFVNIGEEKHMLEILKWFTDYFLRSTFRDASGNVVAFAYQVGEGNVDHQIWSPPELLNLDRPAYFASAETPASDQAAGAAAALALMYLDYKSTDLAYANKCLDTAQALYRFAVKYRGLGYSGGFYGSSDDNDELAWAAVWLFTATGTQSYIDDIMAVSSDGHYTGYLGKVVKSTQDDWQNIWVHSWDTVWGGVFVALANILPDNARIDYYARWNLEFWSGGAVPHQDPRDTNYIAKTPGGFSVVSTWGSARYNTAAQLCALIYSKHKGRTDLVEWARGQMDYIMGANPMKYSYIVGYPTPEAACKHPHHRAAHGSYTNSMFDPPTHRHVLWGALCGGPDNADYHEDQTDKFVYNEVAVDYNAGFVGALAGLYASYGAGQLPIANFPPSETGEQAYAITARQEQLSNTQGSQVAWTVTAVPSHPPHMVRSLVVRYFFDISELVAAGQDISAVQAKVYYDEQASRYGGTTVVRGPLVWDAAKNIYYVEVDWSGNDVYGTRDFQLALVSGIDSTWKFNWDASNDWSHQGLVKGSMTATNNIPVYVDGKKVFGQEPGTGGGGGGGAISTLTVTKAGTGSGTVTSSPSGVSCGSTCSAGFSSTATVTLSAAAASGSTFAGWGGACTSTTGTCTVAMSAARSVTATFALSSSTTNTLTVTKAGTGSGTVTSSSSGVSCGGTCSASFSSTATVTLTAAAASGSTFAGWGGACTNTTGTCTVAMSAAQSVTATFTLSSSGGTTPCSNPVTMTGGQSGNFNTAGAVCLRTSAAVNGWGCSNFSGRTVSVNGGTAASACGAMPVSKWTDGYTYFSISAGTYTWASLFYW
jgi:hypothetical protein